MAHTLYSFIDELQKKQSAERLLYVSSATYNNDWMSLFHSHSFSELFYVLDGEGTFCSEEERIPLKPDSLIIINPNIRHTETSSAEKPLTYIVLGIDNLQFNFHWEDESSTFRVFDMKAYKHLLLPTLHAMLDELRHKNDFYEQICQNYLSVLLLKIIRITKVSFDLFSHENLPGECQFVKDYLDSHYQQEITLATLAELTHLNKYYLSHMFSQAYGISPINYLLERRLLQCKNMLRTSDYSITEIAQLTGFSSSNYFTQYFKKHTGMTPRKYKLKYLNRKENTTQPV